MSEQPLYKTFAETNMLFQHQFFTTAEFLAVVERVAAAESLESHGQMPRGSPKISGMSSALAASPLADKIAVRIREALVPLSTNREFKCTRCGHLNPIGPLLCTPAPSMTSGLSATTAQGKARRSLAEHDQGFGTDAPSPAQPEADGRDSRASTDPPPSRPQPPVAPEVKAPTKDTSLTNLC